LTIPVAAVKTGNSVPIVFIPAPGAGYVVKPLEFSAELVYNGVTYNGAGGLLKLITDTGTIELGSVDIVTQTSSKFLGAIYAAQGSLVRNKAIYIQGSHDHAAGDGTITVYCTYIIFPA